jgi:Domain of unknown function (DUF4279)
MRISVALRVHGPQVDPKSVTAVLGVHPTEQHKAGDRRTGREGRSYDVFTSGLWSIDSDLPDSASLSEQVLNVLKRVDAAKLKRMAATDVQIDLFVGVFLHDEPSSVLVTSTAAEKIAALGIPLDIAIYP